MTSPTYIYVMQADSGPVKIGSSRSPEERLGPVRLSRQAGIKGDIELKHCVAVPGELSALKVERTAHALASKHRLGGEWFDMHPDEALEAIHKAIECGGVDPNPMERTVLNIPIEIKKLIRDFRFEQRLESDADAIRQLLVDGLRLRGEKADPDKKAA